VAVDTGEWWTTAAPVSGHANGTPAKALHV